MMSHWALRLESFYAFLHHPCFVVVPHQSIANLSDWLVSLAVNFDWVVSK